MVGGLLGIDDSVNATMAAIWACLALSLLFAEIANGYQDIRLAARSPERRAMRQPAPAYSLDAPTGAV